MKIARFSLFRPQKKPVRLILIVVLAILAVTRFTLITKGHLYLDDELRYRHTLQLIKELEKGDIKGGLYNIFCSYGRPGFTIISLVPAFLQYHFSAPPRITESYKLVYPQDTLPIFDLSSYKIPSAFNVLISIFVSFFFYRIALLLIKKRVPAVTATIVFSLLNASYMFIRHMLPYYHAILILFIALYIVLRESPGRKFTYKKTILVGFLISFALTVYQPYYVLAGAIALLAVYKSESRLKSTVIILLALFLVHLLFEILAHAAGTAFILQGEKMKHILTDSADDNTYQLAFIFWLVYMVKGEGVLGGVLIVFFALFVFLTLPKRGTEIRTKILYTTLICGYIAHAVLVYFPKYFILFTRQFYVYMPFIVIGAVYFIGNLKKARKPVMACLLVLSIVSFAFYFRAYSMTDYPRDFFRRVSIEYPDKKITNTCEFYPKKLQDMLMYAFLERKYDILTVNLRTIPPDFRSFAPLDFPNKLLVESKPHPLISFTPYLYSDYSPVQRKIIEKNKTTMRLYRFR
ncbi:MAG: hypothetical protein JW994_01505 [Candidatus Omnitrophica bacterium]|nr:hypothetical protein [Candidatus Omnitrophota bacterium]